MKMATLFSGLACFWVIAAGAAIWSSLTRSGRRRRRLLTISWIITGIVFAIVDAIFWILRDGLGPDSIRSTGLVATRRLAHDAWFPSFAIIMGESTCRDQAGGPN